MDRGGDPTPPPPAKSLNRSGTTTIDSLGDDILLDIFLHLPTLASLIRAAFTCRAWRRAVASSPAFRRRFRELHRAPLLGLVAEPQRDSLPSFAPALCCDPDVLAAIRGGDFVLTPLLDPNNYASDVASLCWNIHDCQDGYLILMNWEDGLLATANPLALQLTDIFEMPINRIPHPGSLHLQLGPPVSLDVHLISSEEEPMWFQLVWLFYNESKVQAAVYSSETGDWFSHPWLDIAERAPPYNFGEHWLQFGLQSNGRIYWPFRNNEHVLKLDTKTMEVAVLELPPYLELAYSFVVGETMDDTLWIVYCTGWSIDILKHMVDNDGVVRWDFAGMIPYDDEANAPVNNDIVSVITMKDGFVYFATSEMIMILCLETMELEKLFPRTFRAHHFHPYIMAWPPSLVGNHGSFAPTQDDVNEA